MRILIGIPGLAALLLGAAAHGQSLRGNDSEGALDPRMSQMLADCRSSFAGVDRQVAEAGVGDASYFRVPGFPYLRSDRLITAFTEELGSVENFDIWTQQLRENDSLGREVELHNLGLPDEQVALMLSDLRLCAVWLNNIELDDEETVRRLVRAAAVPAEYPQLLGRGELRPPNETANPAGLGEPQLWRVQREADPAELPSQFRRITRDSLGRIGLVMSAWRALVEHHAPVFLVDTAGAHDRPGLPVFRDGRPGVDSQQPVVHYLISFARSHGRSLVQISYFLWFDQRPPLRAEDAAAGDLDGLIWRVTLDDDGRPLVYDTLSSRGTGHQWFAAPGVRARAATTVAGTVPAGEMAVRVASASHQVVGLMAPPAAAAVGQYRLQPYENLTLMDDGKGGTRSLFGPDGVVPGSERAHAEAAWPEAVDKPGAVRQSGFHALSFSRGLYFDDPRLIDQAFEVPPPASVLSEAAGQGAAAR
ncbi:MAG TPA: hypothetical protein VFV27_11480 [Nevskiaceae bacterium]|nr:hypothetical protein [Nevskiaceae bacterium]